MIRKEPHLSYKTRAVIGVYSEVQRKILLFGETSLPEPSYRAFRRLVMEEFGYGGAKDKVKAILSK